MEYALPFVRSNAIDLCYETFGDPADPTVLLIMGLGEQMIAWPDGFCTALAARGFHVVRFDNRDIGLSTWLDHLGDVNVPALFAGDLSSVPYGLSDMAADAAGLLEALGVRRAHLVGVSMGGMIAQLVAVERPDLVASLASVMSTTGDRSVGQTTLDDVSFLMPRPDADREAAIAADVALYRLIGSSDFEISEDDRVRDAAAKVDRAHHPAGTVRQFAAIVTAADRTPSLRTLRVPAVVIHGEADRLVDVSGGRATAAAVPGAELVLIPGMGHDLPEGAWGRIVNAIATNTAKA